MKLVLLKKIQMDLNTIHVPNVIPYKWFFNQVKEKWG